MVLNKILKELTREEFIENIRNNTDGDFIYKGLIYECPSSLELKEGCWNNTCVKCWLRAIENLRFKGDNKMSTRKELETLLKEKREEYRKMHESIQKTIDEIKNLPVTNFEVEEEKDCYLIDVTGNVYKIISRKNIIRNYNTFTNTAYAEKLAYKQWFERKLLAYKDEHGDKCDWKNGDSYKYNPYIRQYGEKTEIDIDKSLIYKDSCIYFNSEELLEKHLEENKQEWINYFNICKELD